MEDSTLVWYIITGIIFYSFGFFIGLMRNLNSAITAVLKDQPIVVRVEQINDKFLAYMILNSTKDLFVEQGASMDEVVNRLREKHPEKMIIVAEVE